MVQGYTETFRGIPPPVELHGAQLQLASLRFDAGEIFEICGTISGSFDRRTVSRHVLIISAPGATTYQLSDPEAIGVIAVDDFLVTPDTWCISSEIEGYIKVSSDPSLVLITWDRRAYAVRRWWRWSNRADYVAPPLLNSTSD